MIVLAVAKIGTHQLSFLSELLNLSTIARDWLFEAEV